MTDTTDFAVGDLVELVGEREQQFERVGNSYGTLPVRPDQQLVVTRVFRDTMILRGRILRVGGGAMVDASIQPAKRHFQLVDPNRPVPPPPRKLGVMPDGEGLINIDHPGIQWLFDDMGAYAEREGYCSQYDALCIKLGIPGRPRDFDVRRTIKGIEIRASIKARSQREANELFTLAMSTPDPAPEPTNDPSV